MPQKRKSMKQIRKIVQLKLSDPTMSNRTLSLITKVSRPVVKQYLDIFALHPVTLNELESMNDDALRIHMDINTPSVKETDENKILFTWLDTHISKLNNIGVTRLLLHEQFLTEHPDGLRYTQFCFVIKQKFQGSETSGVLNHKAGEKMYIDFTGEKLHWKDTKSIEYTEEIFLSVLGASAYVFAVPTPSQKMKDFCYATEQAFHFYGGVPRAVVPDCLKSAVLSHDGYESIMNPLFQRLLEHYGTVCVPARPRKPKDKPYAEGSVNLIYRQIIARMGERVFNNREDMLKWWFQSLEKINLKPFQKLPGSRLIRFETIEKQSLKALALTRFDLSAILTQKVSTTGVVYIADDKTSYSVPSALIGDKVEILVMPAEIQIWHEGERKALHTRQKDAGTVICPTHRSSKMKWYEDRAHGELLRELETRGTHIASFAKKIDQCSAHEDLAWQSHNGLKRLYSKYPQRLDTVCRIALKNCEYTLRALKRILKNEEDLLLLETEAATPELPMHTNIRGAAYYQGSEASA